MRIAFSIIFLFFFNVAFSDSIDDIIQIIEKKNINSFEKYLNNRISNTHCADPGSIRKREILNNYFEVSIPMLFFIPATKDKYNWRCQYYLINLISLKFEIIKYSIYAVDYNGGYFNNKKLIKEYTKQSSFKQFEDNYEKIYYRKLDQAELFDLSTVYGSKCGFIGVNPAARDKMEIFLSCHNMEALFNWLTSPNFEKKLYAYEGYKILIENGYIANDKEKVVLSGLKNFKGYVNTCSGCTGMGMSFIDVLNDIKNQEFKTQVVSPEANRFNKRINFSKRESNSNYLKFILLASVLIVSILVFLKIKHKG